MRSLLQTAAGTTPDPTGHPDEPTPAVLIAALIAILFAQGDTLRSNLRIVQRTRRPPDHGNVDSDA